MSGWVVAQSIEALPALLQAFPAAGATPKDHVVQHFYLKKPSGPNDLPGYPYVFG